jgi:hypothetical protein
MGCALHAIEEVPARLRFLVFAALTSPYHADKNANFFRQAVSFRSRNGRSAINPLKANCFWWVAEPPAPRRMKLKRCL